MQPDALSRGYRAATLTIRAHTVKGLVSVWPGLDWQNLDQTFPAWLHGVTMIVNRDRKMSTALAAAYLPEFRKASNVAGSARIVQAEPAPSALVAASMSATALAPLKTAAKRGTDPVIAMRNAFVTSSGAASRLVLNGGRDTIFATGQSDPATVGWYRETSGDPCAFCALLASRGGVYYSEDTAGFEAHDHCSCEPEPLYNGQSTLPRGPAAGWARLYDEHAKGGSDQLNAFRRAYSAK